MFNASVSTLSVARICCCLVIGCSKRKYKECYVAFTLETNPGAFVSFWKHISKLASSILWVCTTSANMIFCPVFVFLLLSSALGEDTGESECSHSYISSQHVVRKKKKKLSVRPNLLIVLFSVVKCWLFSFYSLQLRRLMWQFDTTQAVLANWEHRRAAVCVSASCFVN